MRRRPFLALIVACATAMLAGSVSAQAPVAAWKPALEGRALLTALRGGGYVLYFRHTSTDFGQNDEKMSGYEDCTTQRNLTDVGRAEARAIGVALKKLAIPVGTVLASPFCRTRETAQLMFGRAEPSPAARGGPADASGDRYAALRVLMSTPVPGRTNLVIASHGNPFRALTELPYLAEGEAAIIAPRGSEGYTVVARVRKDQWLDLERSS
jgi:phosphohistidine phosphatase SixA